MNDELLSAHLDGELDAAETAAVEAALAADPKVAARYAELGSVRAMLRGERIELRRDALERIVSAVDAADAEVKLAPVVSLSSRRRVPGFAAVAAAIAIIAGVVGGVGGTASLPAIGDLVAQHEAAAAVMEGSAMPEEFDGMDDMPMEEAMALAPPMPDGMAMQHAFLDGPTLQLVYLTVDGEPVSLFRHAGEPDLDSMAPDGLSPSESPGMWSGPTGDAYVAVVDGSGFVWVVVSEEPHDDMMDDMMDELPTRSPSVGDRIRDTADWIVEPFRFGD